MFYPSLEEVWPELYYTVDVRAVEVRWEGRAHFPRIAFVAAPDVDVDLFRIRYHKHARKNVTPPQQKISSPTPTDGRHISGSQLMVPSANECPPLRVSPMLKKKKASP